MRTRSAPLLALVLTTVVAFAATGANVVRGAALRPAPRPQLYETSHQCLACHNGLATPSGEDVSIGASWRATMMANSARDPYWQASVRREVLEHPNEGNVIQDECATCHMPMMRSEAHTNGALGEVLARLPLGNSTLRADRLAADGVSCT